jgi:hypothetical protein
VASNGSDDTRNGSNGSEDTWDARRHALSMRTEVELLRHVIFDLIDEAIHLADPHGTDVPDTLQRVANELGVVEAQLFSAQQAGTPPNLVRVA